MSNIGLNCLREFTLEEILGYFEDKKFLVEITKNYKVYADYATVYCDDEYDNDVGFFVGNKCE